MEHQTLLGLGAGLVVGSCIYTLTRGSLMATPPPQATRCSHPLDSDSVDDDGRLADHAPQAESGDGGAVELAPQRSERDDDQSSQNLLNLLFNIAEVQAIKEGGITCNRCQMSPIRGHRFKCVNCVDFDLCENCEMHDRHDPTHTFLRIKIPIPPFSNPRTQIMRQTFYPGNPNAHEPLSWQVLQDLQQDSHFDQVELEALYEQFKSLAAKPEGFSQEIFLSCLGPLGLQENLVTERMFMFFDTNHDGHIDFVEFVLGLSVLIKGSQEEKIKHAFKGYDLDGDGLLSKEELTRMFKAYFALSMELVRDVVKAMEEEMMARFKDEGDKPVSSLFTAPIPSNQDSSPTKPTLDDLDTSFASRAHTMVDGGNVAAIMETMSQDAIDELIKSAFEFSDDQRESVTESEFVEWCRRDATIIAWFESLGTIF